MRYSKSRENSFRTVKYEKKTSIEAGTIHFHPEQLLCHGLAETANVAITNVDHQALRDLCISGSLFSSGVDDLPLYRIQNYKQSNRTKLLAARALINNKIVQKEEITDSSSLYRYA